MEKKFLVIAIFERNNIQSGSSFLQVHSLITYFCKDLHIRCLTFSKNVHTQIKLVIQYNELKFISTLILIVFFFRVSVAFCLK